MPDVGIDATTAAPHLAMTLSRPSGTSQISVHVVAIGGDGAPAAGLGPVELTTPDGVSSLPEAPAATYDTTLAPTAPSGEYPITAHLAGLTDATATPLLLPTIDDRWDLAERVPGSANTTGYEDSVEVSPDGQWLVLEYSPVDLLCCSLGGSLCGGIAPNDPNSAACEDVTGPYAAPERPDLPGAERIQSPTHIVDACATVGLLTQQSFALPPVGQYGFHLQADGSFGEPFLIGFTGDDGCLSPFGISFVGAPNGTAAQVVFAWDDPRDYGPDDTGNDLYSMAMTLGAPVSLGQLSWNLVTSTIDTESFVPSELALQSVAGGQGNPHFAAPYLWFDDESQAERDLYFSVASGALPEGPFTAKQTVALSQPGRAEIQPFADGATLYYTVNAFEIASADLVGDDPSSLASWSAERVDIGGETGTRNGAVIAIGEPSIAHVGSDAWLYFIYFVVTPTGVDSNVGRIRSR